MSDLVSQTQFVDTEGEGRLGRATESRAVVSAATFGGAEATVDGTFTLAFGLDWSYHGPHGTDMTGKTLDVSFDVAK